MRIIVLASAACAFLASNASSQGSDSLEAMSLLGKALYRPVPSPAVRAQLEARLDSARRDLERDPGSADALIWVGRRTAYLGRYRDAIEVFSQGVTRFPGDARFLRHRGHRYISIRKLDDAVADLTRAWALVGNRPDEVEPDGMPNARNIPTSTLKSNICYHLGLAHFLKGDFARALPVYQDCERVSGNPDMLVATRYWHYMTLRRLGRHGEATELLQGISADMDIIENGAYHRLLLLNKGVLPLDSLTRAGGAGVSALDSGIADASLWYGIGSWHLYNGRREEADSIFRRIVSSPSWSAFGYIAAEAELARSRKVSK
jgi:tetratricopeptide (TPR) repeat protein